MFGSRCTAWSPLARLGALLIGLLLTGAPARAETRSQLLLLRPHGEKIEPDASLNRALLSALAAYRAFEALPQPALDLEASQLAIDCIGASARCLREVATRAHADALLAPTLARKGGKLELSILYFNAKDADAEARRASRTQAGKELSSATLDAIPALLRELLGEPAREPAREPEETDQEKEQAPAGAADEASPAAATEPSASPASAQPFPLGPVLLGGAGVLTLGAGVALGVAMRNTEHNYAAQPVRNEEQAAAADATRRRGERQALVANVLLGVGGAALAVAAIWLSVDLTQEPKQTALAPMLGPDRAGLVLYGQLGTRD